MRRMRSGCCARTEKGHAIAPPPITLMKSRRLIMALEGQSDKVSVTAQINTLEGAELPQCPLWVKKRTCAMQKAMSALPPIATAKANSCKRVQLGMSAL